MGWTQRNTTDGNFVKLGEDHAELIGTWKGTRPGKYGNLGIVETGAGEVVFPITAGLRDLEAFTGGEMVKINFEGYGTTKDGNQFKRFAVFTDDTEPPF